VKGYAKSRSGLRSYQGHKGKFQGQGKFQDKGDVYGRILGNRCVSKIPIYIYVHCICVKNE
jgi:hypothetical protein